MRKVLWQRWHTTGASGDTAPTAGGVLVALLLPVGVPGESLLTPDMKRLSKCRLTRGDGVICGGRLLWGSDVLLPTAVASSRDITEKRFLSICIKGSGVSHMTTSSSSSSSSWQDSSATVCSARSAAAEDDTEAELPGMDDGAELLFLGLDDASLESETTSGTEHSLLTVHGDTSLPLIK